MNKKVLIGGGSGLVGKRLTEILKSKGYQVSHLSRNANGKETPTIEWDVNNMKLDASKIRDFDHILNLTGAGIVDEAWTEKRKQVIINSRVKSTQLLAKAIKENDKKPESFVSASAVGFYGFVTGEKIFTEDDKPGDDFLAETCVLWEESTNEIKNLGIPTSKIRIGIVLAKEGGALKEMAKPVKFYVGAALGNGKQYMPWVHIDDLCNLFIHAMENKLDGAYNAGAPHQVNNIEFTKTLAKVLKKPLWLPNVPAFVMKLILGTRALLVMEGSRVSAIKTQKSGFEFKFEKLEGALKEIYE